MICPLCDQEVDRFHKKSHIIPDSMFERCYDDKHKLVSVITSSESVESTQTSSKASFMCEKCETESNNIADNYATVLLKNHPPRLVKYYNFKKETIGDKYAPQAELWTGLDFKKIQNFVFICCLRQEMASRLNGETLIGGKHFGLIKRIYKNSQLIDDQSYPILISKVSHADSKFRELAFMPCEFRNEGHRGIAFRVLGFIFHLYTSSHKKPDNILFRRLHEDGSWIVPLEDFSSNGAFKSSFLEMNQIIRKNHKV